MNSRDVIAAVVADGWFLDRVKGSHHQFRHPTKPGIVTVPHPKKDLKRGLVKSVEHQAGIQIWDK
jgi:predicted RNA binding protein YcfA (HicA-like mRNA interferase family)